MMASDTINNRTWSGDPVAFGRESCAVPYVVNGSGNGVSVVGVIGSLNRVTTNRLAGLALDEAKRPGTEVVILAFSSACGEIDCMLLAGTIIEDLRNNIMPIPGKASVVAWIEMAGGP